MTEPHGTALGVGLELKEFSFEEDLLQQLIDVDALLSGDLPGTGTYRPIPRRGSSWQRAAHGYGPG